MHDCGLDQALSIEISGLEQRTSRAGGGVVLRSRSSDQRWGEESRARGDREERQCIGSLLSDLARPLMVSRGVQSQSATPCVVLYSDAWSWCAVAT